METQDLICEGERVTWLKGCGQVLQPNEACPAGSVPVEGEVIGQCNGRLCVKIDPHVWRKACEEQTIIPQRRLPKLKPRVREVDPSWAAQFKETRPDKAGKKWTGSADFNSSAKKSEDKPKQITRPGRIKAKKSEKKKKKSADDNSDQSVKTRVTALPMEELIIEDTDQGPRKQTFFVFDVCVKARKVPASKKKQVKQDCECRSLCCDNNIASGAKNPKTNVTVENTFLTKHQYPQTSVTFFKK